MEKKGQGPGVKGPEISVNTSMRSLSIAAAIFLVMSVLTPTAHALWPLWWRLGDEVNFLGPIASYEQKDGKNEVTVRPFLFSYTSQDKDECLFPYPLGKWSEEKSYLVPFFSRRKTENSSAFSLLLFFYGKENEKRYGGFFPLYGSLYNRFGEDEIHFYAWPLYASVSGHGATRKDILWPFFSLYGGDDSGFKTWPVFGSRTRKNGDSKKFFLWPVFFKIDRDMDVGEPKHSFWAFPFYMQTRTPTYDQYSFLWPFFGYYRSEEEKRLSLLYPIYSSTKGEEEQSAAFFPFYSSSRTKESSNFYILWPIYRESERISGEKRWIERRVLLFGSKYLDDDRGKFFNVWPFFEYRGEKEEESFFFPSLLPYRDNHFDRIIRPMITLYQYNRKGQSNTTNVLYGLYTKEQRGDSWKRRLAFVFEMKKDSEGMGLELLSGLFGFDAKQIKLFFIPIKRQ